MSKNKKPTVMAKNLKDRIQNRFEKFCDDTSMHGFIELYYAKSIFWKVFWIMAVIGSFGVTTYQVQAAIYDYIYQSSSTTIQAVQQGEMLHPPLKICISHWINWIDWNKAYAMKFNKEGILYGFSFLTKIYSSNFFDLEKAKQNFQQGLKANNIKNVLSFYKAVTKPVTEFVELNTVINPFTMVQINWDMKMCYIAPSENVHTTLLESINASSVRYFSKKIRINSLSFSIKVLMYDHDKEPFTDQEYNSYMAEWVETTCRQYGFSEPRNNDFSEVRRNYRNMVPPLLIYPDGFRYDGIKLDYEVDEYTFSIKASASVWKSTSTNPCSTEYRSIVSNATCHDYCKAKSGDDAQRSCLGCTKLINAIFLNSETVGNLCQNNITFIKNYTLLNQNETASAPTTQSPPLSQSQTNSSNNNLPRATSDCWNSTINENYTTEYSLCSQQCILGCQRWSYDVSVRSSSVYERIKDLAVKRGTEIIIEYPIEDETLLMIETDSQTWENFIGSVGGLLGIWTGASILSFIQVVYLCCCCNGF